MSKASKGVKIDKIKAEFEKADLDDQINAFHQLKDYLTEKIVARANELDEKKDKLLSEKDKINK